MAKHEWIGEYQLRVEELKTYKNEWVEQCVSLGRCFGNDDACSKAAITLIRDFPTSQLRNVYVVDGWGHLIHM